MIHQTTIDDTAGICTLINTFTVEPANQQQVVAQLRRFTSEAGHQPGFIAASVHASLDGERSSTTCNGKPANISSQCLRPRPRGGTWRTSANSPKA